MNNTYYQWKPIPTPWSQVQDRRMTEDEYQRFWRALRFPRKFTTCEGESLLVIDGGIPNRNAGPDFVNAVLLVDGKIRRGAVEVHVDSSGWTRHGHHTDPRYANVILQVIGRAADGRGSSGTPFRPMYTIVLPEVPANSPGPRRGRRCQHEPVSGHAGSLLAELGLERLGKKSRRYHQLLGEHSPEDLWYRYTLRSLGYGANATNMELIARRLPLEVARELAGHLSPEHLFQFVLGFTGYGQFYALRTPVWEELSSRYRLKGFRYHDWGPLSSRPLNHPLFRIYLFLGALETWLQCYRRGGQNQTPGTVLERLRVNRPVPRPYASLFRMPRIAIGTSRAVEVLMNCYLPLWMATAKESGRLRIADWAGRLPPIPRYGSLEKFIQSTRWQDRFRGRTLAPLVSQGFLRLRSQWCQPGLCRQCPMLSKARATVAD